MLESDNFFTVTDLKQYTFCPRVVFYERCLPHLRPRTYKMDAGRDAHDDEQKRSARRTLSRFGLEQGERLFDVPVMSERFALRGLIDELILTDDNLAIPVDYKLAQRLGEHHQLQVTAYACMVEETFGRKVNDTYIYLIPRKELVKVPINDNLRAKLESSLAALVTMVLSECMPEAAEQISRCAACEFRRFCNDTGL